MKNRFCLFLLIHANAYFENFTDGVSKNGLASPVLSYDVPVCIIKVKIMLYYIM